MSGKLTHIVYVDDEEDIRTVAQMALEMVGGIRVDLCSSGREGLEKIKAVRPQMVLLDVMMPEMDGPETLAMLRADPDLSSIPVAFMTAKIRPDEVDGLLKIGAIGVIAKPFDPMALSDQVSALWEKFQTE